MTQTLTPKQREAVELLARGYTKPEIADQLGLTLAAVQTRILGARHKTQTRTAAQLVAWAITSGEIPQEDTNA